MENGKKIKRDTQLIIISVLLLTISSLNVSYSAFFSVKTQSTIQEFDSGELVVSASNLRDVISSEFLPTSAEDINSIITGTDSSSEAANQYATLDIQNTGNLKSDYSVAVASEDLPDGITALDLEYLYVAVYDITNGEWQTFDDSRGNSTYYTTLSSLKVDDSSPIIRDTIDAREVRQYRVYIWLSESVKETDIGKGIYLNLDVKSLVSET